jgi:hypothetical protein
MSLTDKHELSRQNAALPEKVNQAREAALEFLPILKAKLVLPDGTLHTGTLLSAAAWLTGTSLYRSFNLPSNELPGTIIKSDAINKEWENLMFLLEQYNFEKVDIPVGRLMLAAMAAPDFLKSQIDMFRIQSELEGLYDTVLQKYGFNHVEGARVGIILCTILIYQYKKAGILDPRVAAGIVAQGVLEAAKTVPYPLA